MSAPERIVSPDQLPDARIPAARDGCADSLASLLEEVGPPVRRRIDVAPKWRTCFDADDVMQITYMEAFLRIGQFSGDDLASFTSWLHRIAQNSVHAAIRGLSRKKRPSPDQRVPIGSDGVCGCDLPGPAGAPGDTPSRNASADESRRLIEQAMVRLPEAYADAIRAFYFEGLTGPDAARRLNRSRGAAFMLLARARDRLQELLGSASQFFTDCP